MYKSAWHGVALGMLAAILLLGLAVPSLLVGAVDRPTPQRNRAADTLADEPQDIGGSFPLVIPAAAFSSDGGDPDGFFFDFAGGYINGDGTACLKAPAYLPAGATVVAVWASLYDNATGSVMVRLRRVNVVSGSSNVMATVSTVSDSTAIQQREDDTISDPVVVYPDYAYYVTTCLNYADHRVYSVRIYYRHRVLLPLVLRDHQ